MEKDFKRTLLHAQWKRLVAGDIRSGQDIADLRAFVGLESTSGLQAAVRRLGQERSREADGEAGS